MKKLWQAALVCALLFTVSPSAQNPRDLDDVTKWMKATGAKPVAPQSPIPVKGATNVAMPVTLSWYAIGADSFEVRFGTSSAPPVVASNWTTNTYTPSNVQPNTKYYWRIIAKNANGTSSATWNFTTAASSGGGGGGGTTPPPTNLAVVPGAYGYGMQTRAAYGCGTAPAILKVTNLNDSGAGSLRAAMEASGPRVVIFEVGGYIDLTDMIRIAEPCITVAGQTAPSPGITLRKYGIEVIDHDVLLQHFRIRPGEWGQYKQDNCALIAYGTETHDIVLDHMSVSWGPDENIAADTYYNGDMNMTIWRSISAEGLDYPASVPDSASHGILVQSKSRKVAVIESLMMTNRERNPYAQSNTSTAYINNVIFNAFANWHFFYANFDIIGNPGSGGPWYSSVVGNRVIAGANTDDDPGSPSGWLFYTDLPGAVVTGNQLYRSDNTVDNTQIMQFDTCPSMAANSSCNEMPYDPTVSSPPAEAPLAGFPFARASGTVEAFVSAHVGARPLNRDGVDARLISDLASRTARGYRNHQNLYGGYPSMPSSALPLTVPANPHVVTSTGYTVLEDWLHAYADALGQ